MTPRIGVCSWSLRPESPDDLVRRVRATGVSALQLALSPFVDDARALAATTSALAKAGVEVRSGMLSMIGEDYTTLESIRRTGGVRPDATWEANRSRAQAVAQIASDLHLPLVTFHAGFLPEERASPERGRMIERLRAVVDLFAARGVSTAFETGQERAQVLLDVLDELDRPDAGVNFDPANLILYDKGDPVAALRELAPRVRQIHVKDARRTKTSGTWGEEVCAGTGEVDWRAFFRVLRERRLDVDLIVEREAGDDRVGDVVQARELVERELAPPSSRRGRDAR